jgi:hypothetical protein
MSIDIAADVVGGRARSRVSSIFTGVLVACLIVIVSVVGQASAHDAGTTSHLWDHINALKLAGTINADANPVHWTKLKGVPVGLADGVDDGVTVAGFGLNRVWSAFWVDPTEVQKRVTTACTAGQAIKSIRQDGTAVCTPVSQAVSKTAQNTGIICNDWCEEGRVLLSPGTWAVSAKIVIFNWGAVQEDEIQVDCRLHASGAIDEASFWLEDDIQATLHTQILVTIVQGGDLGAKLDCKDYDVGDLYGSYLSIIAVRTGG